MKGIWGNCWNRENNFNTQAKLVLLNAFIQQFTECDLLELHVYTLFEDKKLSALNNEKLH